MEKIDKDLLELYAEMTRKEKIQIHLKNLYRTTERKKLELKNLEKQLEKEAQDIDELEEKSLYSLFHSILGNKKEKLEVERQEYLQVFMKVRGLKENLKMLSEEKHLLQKTYSGLQEVDDKFENLLEEKLKRLMALEECPAQLVEFNKALSGFYVKVRELETCIKKGEIARGYMEKVSLGLQELEAWGEDVKSNKVKVRKKIGRVNKDVYIANNFLQKFEDELVELGDHFELNYQREVMQFENFLDQFVDALITDWIVKHRIYNSNNLILNINDVIRKLSEMLTYEIEKTESFAKETENEKAEFIVNYLAK